MEKELLFKYRINGQWISVYRSVPVTENVSFYSGAAAAAAQYLCYPYEVIAPRAKNMCISFEHGGVAAADDVIKKETAAAFLGFFEANASMAEKIIPPYTVKPDLSESKLQIWTENMRNTGGAELDIQNAGGCGGGGIWLKFTYSGGTFYAKYRESTASEYLIVSLPCMNADWNDISYLYGAPCDIIQIVPLGYNTPSGFAKEKIKYGSWPVLFDTVTETDADTGYNKWFRQACMAVNAFKKDKKIIFTGTSQGGGAALVMSSVFCDITEACLAEMPFFIGLSDKRYEEVRDYAAYVTGKPVYDFYAKERLFVTDPLAHADRIKCKTLLAAGELDRQCPKEDIGKLFGTLKCEKQYVELKGAEHGYTEEFKLLAKERIYEIAERRIK